MRQDNHLISHLWDSQQLLFQWMRSLGEFFKDKWTHIMVWLMMIYHLTIYHLISSSIIHLTIYHLINHHPISQLTILSHLLGPNADNFSSVNSKLDDVKNVMVQNIEMVLERWDDDQLSTMSSHLTIEGRSWICWLIKLNNYQIKHTGRLRWWLMRWWDDGW